MSEPSKASDPALLARIERAKRGDRVAMKELVLAWQPRVRNLVRYLVRGNDVVDDVSQQSLLTVLEKLDAFRGEGRAEAWVDGIVLRVTIAHMRKLRLRSADELHEDQTATDGPFTLPVVDRAKLMAALDEVPFKQRSALVMHHVLGMSVPEISELERVPNETVRSRLRHGMQLLRHAMGVRGGDDG